MQREKQDVQDVCLMARMWTQGGWEAVCMAGFGQVTCAQTWGHCVSMEDDQTAKAMEQTKGTRGSGCRGHGWGWGPSDRPCGWRVPRAP